MKLYLGDMTLPEYSSLTEIVDPNATELYGLDKTLSVDFVNVRRGWRYTRDLLPMAEYTAIREKFNLQFTSGEFNVFGIPDLGINVPVYMKINDKDIKYNNQFVENFEMELLEQNAI